MNFTSTPTPKPRLELIPGGADVAPPHREGLPWAGAPHGDELVVPAGYALDERGVLRELGGKDGEIRYVLVYAAPIYISAQSEDITTGASILRVCWRMAGGSWREADWPASRVMDGRELARAASDARCPMSGATAKAVTVYLEAFLHANRDRLPVGRVSSSLGWVGRDGEGGYLAGEELLCAPPGEGVSFRGEGDGERQIVAGIERRGTLEGWQRAIAPMLAHPAASMALWAVFAAPLLLILERPGFTVDFSGGGTTTGKSTVCRAAMAAVGDPERICRSWEARQVGIERLIALHGGGMPLYLDDTRQALRPEEVGRVLMAVSNGHGRVRGAVRGMAATSSWRTVLLSTGEAPAVSFSEGGGEQARCISVTGLPFGEKSPAMGRVAARIEAETGRHYGHAMPIFIEAISKLDRATLRERWAQLEAAQAEALADSELGQRLAGHRAVLLLAAELARSTGVVPDGSRPVLWGDSGEAAEAAAQAPEEVRARARIASWVASEARGFVDSDSYPKDGSSPAAILGKWGEDEIAILPKVLEDRLKQWGFSPRPVIEGASRRGWLRRDGRHLQPKVPLSPDNRPRCFVFLRRFLFEE